MTSSPMTSERLHALDATRAFALLVGIVLHATMSFFIFIPAKDVSPSTTLAVTFYVIHIFRMSLFYVMAGFFAHMVFHRSGARAFLKDRAKRIFVPMTVGWLLLAPPTIGIIIWGLSRSFPGAAAGAAAPAAGGFPLIHLWFLYYLCLFYVLTLTLRGGFVRLLDRSGLLRARIDRVLAMTLKLRVLPVLLALPVLAVLFLDAAWPLWFGIPTPDHGFTPQLPAMVIYGSAFALGWLLHRQVALLALFEQRWRSNVVLAIGFTAAALVMVGPTPFAPAPATVASTAWMRLAYTACYALAVWFWTFGLIGAAMRWCAGRSAVRRYLADSSYWLYLLHVPVVFGLQVLLADLPLHWTIKLPLILAITFAVLLLSYHYLVRATVIGEILNGRRYPRRLPQRPALATPAVVETSLATMTDLEPGCVARLSGVTKRYGKTVALAGLDLSARAGELLAVLGPNGAGKTTAIDLWLGMRQADAGAVSLLGGSPLDVHSRLGVGVMLQDVELAPQLCPREQIALAASYYRDPLSVDAVITLVGIEAFARKRYIKLSAGQKRQVQFAVAICGRPRLLFLDEPSVGLDVEAREALWRNIRRLVKDGCAVVLTTHYLEEAEALANRVAVVAHGKCIAEGSVEQMRALVERKRIRCASSIDLENIRRLPGVVDVARENDRVLITATDAESVVWHLMTADPALRHLEVSRASLADAFTALVKEAA